MFNYGMYSYPMMGASNMHQYFKARYGNENDLLEIMGGLTEEELKYDSVLGNLTAEEVFKRFKYCYENNTSIYEE